MNREADPQAVGPRQFFNHHYGVAEVTFGAVRRGQGAVEQALLAGFTPQFTRGHPGGFPFVIARQDAISDKTLDLLAKHQMVFTEYLAHDGAYFATGSVLLSKPFNTGLAALPVRNRL